MPRFVHHAVVEVIVSNVTCDEVCVVLARHDSLKEFPRDLDANRDPRLRNVNPNITRRSHEESIGGRDTGTYGRNSLGAHRREDCGVDSLVWARKGDSRG